MNKVLIVTYYWPPSGGAGVQRWLKFAKYLPDFDWEPIILTVNSEFAAYPVTDFSLFNDLPPALRVCTTRAINYFSIYNNDKSRIPSAGFANSLDNTLKGKLLRFIRGNFFLPDPRRGWNRYAIDKASELIDSENIKYIITTSPPHSSQLIGLKLKRKYPFIIWVADLRDPWTDIYYYKQFYPTFFSRAVDRQYEKRILKNADKIITVGSSLKKLLCSKVAGTEGKTTVITNGYDETDFKDYAIASPVSFTITYVGTLSDIYPVTGLMKALKSFMSSTDDFILRFVGTVSDNAKKLLMGNIPATSLEFLPYTEHSEAVRYMMNSTLQLLIIPDHQTSKIIITGKLFEYIGSGKPILCLGPPDGDAAALIMEAGAGLTCGYNDGDAILEFLLKVKSKSIPDSSSEARLKFSRKNLTRQISAVLKS